MRRPGVAPLTLGRKKPSGFLLVAYTTQMDDFAKHLMVTKSEVGIYADETRRRMVFHYDYDDDTAFSDNRGQRQGAIGHVCLPSQQPPRPVAAQRTRDQGAPGIVATTRL